MPATLDLEAFAHIIAHDLGAPVRGMSIHLKLLAADLAKGDQRQAAARIALLEQRLRRLDEMVRRVRDFSRIHVAAGHDGTVELGALVAEAMEHIEAGTATVECSGAARVHGPPLLILTMLQELIRNAISHHDGEPHVRIEIHDGVLTVTDDGPGLPAGAHEVGSLFSLAGHHVRSGGGSGLALSHYIADHLGGSLELTSPVHAGRGVEARLRLPAAPAR